MGVHCAEGREEDPNRKRPLEEKEKKESLLEIGGESRILLPGGFSCHLGKKGGGRNMQRGGGSAIRQGRANEKSPSLTEERGKNAWQVTSVGGTLLCE